MVLPTVPMTELNNIFPRGTTTMVLPSGLNYMRKTPQP